MTRRLPLLVGIGYPVVLFGILFLVVRRDAFAIFDEVYLMATGVALPALVLTLSVIALRRGGGGFWLPVLALIVWIGVVTLAHFWVVAQLAAGV